MSEIQRLGKYEIVGILGQGSFGVVYRGRDPYHQLDVAIKVCTLEDEELRRRFFREAEISNRLRHANVVGVHAFAFEGGIPYLVQEYLEGEDLRDVIRRRAPWTAERKLGALAQVAEGMAYAHSQGVIHRDLKPGNIRLLSDGRVKIMDFGIAKLANEESRLTQKGVTLGTASYLPPEQVRGSDVDVRADIFSFGVMAYELLSYERPFRGKTISALVYQILYKEPLALDEVWSACPPALSSLIGRCLQKEAEDRYPDVRALMADLQSFQEEVKAGHWPNLLGPVSPEGKNREESSSSSEILSQSLISRTAKDVSEKRDSLGPSSGKALGSRRGRGAGGAASSKADTEGQHADTEGLDATVVSVGSRDDAASAPGVTTARAASARAASASAEAGSDPSPRTAGRAHDSDPGRGSGVASGATTNVTAIPGEPEAGQGEGRANSHETLRLEASEMPTMSFEASEMPTQSMTSPGLADVRSQVSAGSTAEQASEDVSEDVTVMMQTSAASTQVLGMDDLRALAEGADATDATVEGGPEDADMQDTVVTQRAQVPELPPIPSPPPLPSTEWPANKGQEEGPEAARGDLAAAMEQLEDTIHRQRSEAEAPPLDVLSAPVDGDLPTMPLPTSKIAEVVRRAQEEGQVPPDQAPRAVPDPLDPGPQTLGPQTPGPQTPGPQPPGLRAPEQSPTRQSPAQPAEGVPPLPAGPQKNLPRPTGAKVTSAPDTMAGKAARSSGFPGSLGKKGLIALAGVLLIGVLAIVFWPSGETPEEPASETAAPAAPAPGQAEKKPAVAAVESGFLLVVASPWGEVVQISDADGEIHSLPAETTTPLRLELPPGIYQVDLQVGEEEVSVNPCSVSLGEVTKCAFSAEPSTLEFFRESGWWR